MTRTLSIGISPCPNDTFIFGALALGRVGVPGADLSFTLADVQELNESASRGAFDVCKVSVAAVAGIAGEYGLLRAGGAMGRGVGPLVVARPGMDLSGVDGGRVALPGALTTAGLLFSLLCRERGIAVKTEHMIFDEVMDAVAAGRADAGVVIHEGRFTYADRGLVKVADLGQWWETSRGLPIPLGAIALRRRLGDMAGALDAAIRASLEYARAHPGELEGYVRRHAQEMDPEIIARHIDTFVTDHSRDVGVEGESAITALVQEAARETGTDLSQSLFF